MSLETRDPLLSRQTATTQKKHDRGWGRRGMRYPACEKLEIIHLVEQSHLPVQYRPTSPLISGHLPYRPQNLSELSKRPVFPAFQRQTFAMPNNLC
jgi:hypothetical protein